MANRKVEFFTISFFFRLAFCVTNTYPLFYFVRHEFLFFAAPVLSFAHATDNADRPFRKDFPPMGNVNGDTAGTLKIIIIYPLLLYKCKVKFPT